MKDKRYRSILKGMTWRVKVTLDTISISWLITGQLKSALFIGGIEVVTKLGLYCLHERSWEKNKRGKKQVLVEYNI